VTKNARSLRIAVVLLAIIGALPPAIAYWVFVGRTPTVASETARDILADPKGDAVLIDVRPVKDFVDHHIEAAYNWPYERIAAATSRQDVPDHFRGKRLLLICESGILGSIAAQRLRSLGVPDVENVQGGMQEWVAAAEKPCTLSLCRFRAKSGVVESLPSRSSPLLEQWAAVLTGFVVKPFYTILSLAIAVVLWRRRSPDLTALRWAMLSFFVGENCCATNYLIYADRSVLFEFLHSYGMVLCFALTTYALFEGIDGRILKLSDADGRCGALGLCQRCIKHADVPCGLRRMFQFLIPAMMIVALAPLSAALIPVSYNTTILGSYYNYSHPVVHLVFEERYLPLVAFVLLGISLAVLRQKQDPMLWSKLFFAAGTGALGFSFLRMGLYHCYRDNLVWFATWEEITEVLFILGVALVLWTFRQALFAEPRTAQRT
jgi:rhodanese-related sulfurtransferase